MRHFLSPRTIAPGPRGMIVSTARGRLVALPGCALFAAPALPGAASLTVDVAAIAARTDQDLDAAARTEIQTRGCICLFAFVTQTWTKAPTDGILPRHTCLGTLWGAAPVQTSRLGSAPCPVFNRDRHLTHLLPLHHQTHRSSAARRIPIPHHSAPCVQPSKQGDGFSVTRADCARERPIAVLPPAVRSSAAQDAALVPCSEASMRARYRKGCGPLRHE